MATTISPTTVWNTAAMAMATTLFFAVDQPPRSTQRSTSRSYHDEAAPRAIGAA